MNKKYAYVRFITNKFMPSLLEIYDDPQNTYIKYSKIVK